MGKQDTPNRDEHFFVVPELDDFPQDLVDQFRTDKPTQATSSPAATPPSATPPSAKPSPAKPQAQSSTAKPSSEKPSSAKPSSEKPPEKPTPPAASPLPKTPTRATQPPSVTPPSVKPSPAKPQAGKAVSDQTESDKTDKRDKHAERLAAKEKRRAQRAQQEPTPEKLSPAKPSPVKPSPAKPQADGMPDAASSQTATGEDASYASLQDELNAVLSKWQEQQGGAPLTAADLKKLQAKKEKKPRVHRGFKGTVMYVLNGLLPVVGDHPTAILRKVVIVVAMVVLIGTLSYIVDETVIIPTHNRVIAEQQREQYTPGSSPELTDEEEAFQYPDGMDPAFKKLYFQNPDIRGWVTYRANGGDDFLDIDYPVMQTDNNEFYLTHDYHLTYNKNGTLFFDYRNDFSNKNYKNRNEIIFGHNMASGQMFGRLNNMLYGLNYAQCAPTFTMNTIYRSGVYKVFAVMVVNTLPEDGAPFQYLQTDFVNDTAFANFLSEIKARSLYNFANVDLLPTDEIVTLSTCNSYSDVYMNDARTVVIGRKLRDGESVDTDISLITDNPNVIMPYGWYVNQGKTPHEYYTNPNYRIEMIPGGIYVPTTTLPTATTTTVAQFALTVAGGTGSGSYPAGTMVTVTADALPEGSRFKSWIATGVTGVDLTQQTLTFAMPANPVTLIASAEATYSLTVAGGTGSGSYAAGSMVTVTATDIPQGYYFAGWLVSGTTLTDPSASTINFIMPAGNVVLTATYGDTPPVPTQPTQSQYLYVTVNGGSGSGYYQIGSSVTVTADAPPAGCYFAGWEAPRLAERGYTTEQLAQATLTFTMPDVPVPLTAKFLVYPTTNA